MTARISGKDRTEGSRWNIELGQCIAPDIVPGLRGSGGTGSQVNGLDGRNDPKMAVMPELSPGARLRPDP